MRGWSRALPMLILVAAFAIVLRPDLAAALRPARPPSGPTWLDELRAQGWDGDELVLAEAPLVAHFYLGRSDFYVHPEGYERYAMQDGPVARSLYTGAVLLKERGDFEQLVARPHAGETIWVVGDDDRLPRLTTQMDPSLWPALQHASGVRRPTRDRRWLLRLELRP